MAWLRRNRGNVFCSFCSKSDRQVDRLIGGGGIIAGAGVYICDRCVEKCVKILKPHQGKTVPEFDGWQSCDDTQLLESLSPTERTLEAVRQDLQAKVEALRERNVSWEAIGNALGVSRQAARERFS